MGSEWYHFHTWILSHTYSKQILFDASIKALFTEILNMHEFITSYNRSEPSNITIYILFDRCINLLMVAVNRYSNHLFISATATTAGEYGFMFCDEQYRDYKL